MGEERLLHLHGPGLEARQEISVTAVKILQHFRKLGFSGVLIEREDSVNDVVGPSLIRGVEVAWLHGGLKRTNEHTGRIWPKIERLPVQGWSPRKGRRWGLIGQGCAEASEERARRGRSTRVLAKRRMSMALSRKETRDSPPRFRLTRSG
jgi:hypothetical protein